MDKPLLRLNHRSIRRYFNLLISEAPGLELRERQVLHTLSAGRLWINDGAVLVHSIHKTTQGEAFWRNPDYRLPYPNTNFDWEFAYG